MKFSIIIPCYRVEKYIRECLDSVLAQKVDSWEAICVDDGSPDGTGTILDEYAARYGEGSVRVIHQKNKGLSAARNAALEIATGEWLLYLDSDDLLSPWALETYVKMAEKYPQADILRAGMARSADGNWNWGVADDECSGMDVQGRVTMYGLGGYFQRMAYRRAVYGDIRFVGMSWCEERPYVAKCVARAKFVADTPVAAYGFRVREGSITHRKMMLAEWKGFLQATMDIAKTFQGSGRLVDPCVARWVMLVWMEKQVFFLCTHLRPEERKEAWNFWFDSLDDLGGGLPVSAWFRFTGCVCRLTRSSACAWLLCFLPHWLKEHGVHR